MSNEHEKMCLQIKPVGSFCNLACQYCYAEPFKHPHYQVMDNSILERILIQYSRIASEPVITWHGGEPT